jgi:hypothetical protein
VLLLLQTTAGGVCWLSAMAEENYRSHFFRFVESAGLQRFLGSTEGVSVETIIEENYHLFDSEVMKLLINSALQERDENLKNGKSESELLGSWGVVIDLFKSITISKREKASTLMQRLCQIGYQQGPEGLEKFIKGLRKEKVIDSVLVDLVSSSYEDCKAMQGGADIVQILKYIDSSFQPEKQHFVRSLAQSKGASSSSSSAQASAAPVSVTQTRGSSSERAAAAEGAGEEESFDQRELLAAGEFLQHTLDTCKGDAKKLKTAILHNLRSPLLPLSLSLSVSLSVTISLSLSLTLSLSLDPHLPLPSPCPLAPSPRSSVTISPPVSGQNISTRPSSSSSSSRSSERSSTSQPQPSLGEEAVGSRRRRTSPGHGMG